MLRLVMVGLAGVLLATALALVAARVVTPSAPPVADAATPSTAPGTTPVAATQLANDGVRASWVVAENQLTGTSAWQITGLPPSGFISGFADQTYATVGQPVRLFVSTSAPTFHVEVYRIGYYGGKGGRLVWVSPDYPGQVQPPCPLTAGVNMVSCDNWTPSISVEVTQYYTQGDYLLKLVGSGNEQSYVPLTVWSPGSHGAYLVKNDVFTWQAWNSYGGYDYYQGAGSCPPGVYPLCTRARVVSYDRPYANGQGTGEFLDMEAPLVRFMEQHGLDVTYVNDMLVQDHPDVLTGHSVLLSLGHDECWSNGERTAVTAANAKGLDIAFFGASAILRHVRTQASALGPDRELADYRQSSADPLNGKGNPRDVTGNTWSSPLASWPESPLIGEDYNGFLDPGVHEPMTVVDPSAWIFNGTGLANNASVPDLIASDVDSLQGQQTHPDDVQVLAHSALPANKALAGSQTNGTFYSDMTYYTDPHAGAGVWDSGTNNWIPMLGSAAVRQMTTNLLWLFGQGPSGRLRPSAANWHSFY
jgi:hypothetical protein